MARRRGWTKKPCDGCGEPGHPMGDVCRGCRKLIEEAKAARATQRDSKKIVRLHFTKPTHWNPAYYDGDADQDARDGVRAAMAALVAAVAEPYVGEYIPTNDIKPLLTNKKSEGYGYNRGYFQQGLIALTREQGQAFNVLDAAIRRLDKSSAQNGFRHGSDLLRRLGEGETSLLDFEDKRKRKS